MHIEVYGLAQLTKKVKEKLEKSTRLKHIAYVQVYLKNNIPKACFECAYFPCVESEVCVYGKKRKFKR
jgi:hypothetical protein